MDERKQFTFYGSIYQALKRIKKASDRCAAYDIICEYALFNIEPDLDKYSDAVGIAFELIRPNLDSSRRKAASGKAGGSNSKKNDGKPEANGKQNESKPKQSETEGEKESEREVEYEIEKENEVEVEVESEPETTATAAERAPSFMNGLGRGVVFLSEAQVNELLELIGLDGFDYYVDKLASFIVEKGAKVRNHYATILKWWEEDCATDIPRRRGGVRT